MPASLNDVTDDHSFIVINATELTLKFAVFFEGVQTPIDRLRRYGLAGRGGAVRQTTSGLNFLAHNSFDL